MSIRLARFSDILLGQTLRRFVDWWLGELRQLVPFRLRQIYRTEPCRLTVMIGAQDVKIYKDTHGFNRSKPQMRLLHHGKWATALPFIVGYQRRWRLLLTVGLRLPSTLCLIRHKSIPSSALHQGGDILRLDLERIAPFKSSEILTDWYRPQTIGGNTSVTDLCQVIAKRELVAPFIIDLEKHHISTSCIDVYDQAAKVVIPVNLLAGSVKSRITASGFLQKAILLMAALTSVVAMAIVGMLIFNQQTARAQLTIEINAAQKTALAITKQLARLDKSRAEIIQHRLRKIDKIPVLRIWEDVTRLLPRTAWIKSLRVENGRLYLNGFAKSASELIALLERSESIYNVSFSSPVIADNREKKERFQIVTKIRTTFAARVSANVAPLKPGDRN